MKTVSLPAANSKFWHNDMPEKLSKAVEKYNLQDKPEWGELDELSSHTFYEGIDVFGEQSIQQKGEFIAPANIHVRLTYGSRREASETNDVYPARVHFKINGDSKGIEIDRIEVDTSSFYE